MNISYLEEERGKIIADLDSYGGLGSTQRKIQEYHERRRALGMLSKKEMREAAGVSDSTQGNHCHTPDKCDHASHPVDNSQPIDTISGSCLIRSKPKNHQRKDTDMAVEMCDECNKEHTWARARGFWNAVLLGLFDWQAVDDFDYPLRELLLINVYEVSYLCHDCSCSDPFHIYRESRFINVSREICHVAAKQKKPGFKCGRSTWAYRCLEAS